MQFFDGKRTTKGIVGASLKRGNTLTEMVASREKKDRSAAASITQNGADLQRWLRHQ
jgi:hypothetical protein